MSSYTCQTCGKVFKQSAHGVVLSCAVAHAPGTCCHYQEEELNSQIEPTPLMGGAPLPQVQCPHQWFEVKRLHTHVCELEHKNEIQCSKGNKFGVLVKCANCLTSKELWE